MRSFLEKLGVLAPARTPYLFLSVSRKVNSSGKCHFSIYDPETETAETVEVPLRLGHSVVGNVNQRRRALAMDQYGTQMCEVDLLERRLCRVIEAGKGRAFYGHGIFSRDGKLFFSAEISNDSAEKGFLVVRDGESFAELNVISSHGVRPHDLALTENGNVLLVANQGDVHSRENGEFTALTFLDVASGKLLRKLEEPTVGFQFSHLASNPAGDIAVGLFHTQAKQDEESEKIRQLIRNPGTRSEGMRRISESMEFHPVPIFFVKDELRRHAPEDVYADMRMTLSLCLHRSKPVLGAIHVMSGLVTFSDVRSNTLLAWHQIPGAPQGIALSEDGSSFVVSNMDDTLFYFDAEDFRLLKQVRPPNFQFGHHMLAWKAS